MGHLLKLSRIKQSSSSSLDELFFEIDSSDLDWPVRLCDTVVVYDTLPVLGAFFTPTTKNGLWPLIESTDADMLLTDGFISGAESLFICRSVESLADLNGLLTQLMQRQPKPSFFVNTFRNKTAILYSLKSFS